MPTDGAAAFSSSRRRGRSENVCSLFANFFLDGRASTTYIGCSLIIRKEKSSHSESALLTRGGHEPSAAWSRQPSPGGRPAGRSETRAMTRRVSGTMDLAAAIRLSADDDPTAMVLLGSREEPEMFEAEIKPRQRRLKSEKKWPRRLRNPRLLKWAFYVGGITYRLLRWWHFLSGPSDG